MYQLGPAEIHYIVDLLPPDQKTIITCASLYIHEFIAPCILWLSIGRRREISRGLSISDGSLRDCKCGDAWTNCSQVCTAAPERRESVTLAVEGEVQVNSVEDF